MEAVANRSRLSLVVLTLLLLGGLAFTGRLTPPAPSDRTSGAAPRDFSRASQSADAKLLRQLTGLSRRQPTDTEWKRVWTSLKHDSWDVVAASMAVLRTHRHADLAKAERQVMDRAIETAGETAEPVRSRAAREKLVRDIVQRVGERPDESTQRLLLRVVAGDFDGRTRARALDRLRTHALDVCPPLVASALADPSEQVRLVALDMVIELDGRGARPLVESLAASARPALRQRAGETLERLGYPAVQSPYVPAVLEAAATLTDRFWQAGFDMRDVLPQDEGESVFRDDERLPHLAERYLDESPSAGGPSEAVGLLLLAAAVRAGQHKLVIRLWEREVLASDSDAEMAERGLETLARIRLLRAIDSCRRGESSAALGQLAPLVHVASHARAGSALSAYVSAAGDLCGEIWQSAGARTAMAQPGQRDSALANAIQVLDSLDLTKPADRAIARSRLDSWCGLAAPPDRTRLPYKSSAN